MTEPFDPFELLRELDPVDRDALRGTASSPQALDALERIVADSRDPAPNRRAHLRIGGIHRRRTFVAVLLPLAAVAAATAWALTRAPTEQLTVGCYASPDLRARTVVVPAGHTSPADTCRRVWRRGDFGTRVSPRLQACVLLSGAIGVFPSPHDRTCERLKLAPLVPGSLPHLGHAAHHGSAAELKDAVVQFFLSSRCLSAQRARTAVRGELRRLQLTGWKAETTTPFTTSRACASFAFDEVRHLVLIIPMPKRT